MKKVPGQLTHWDDIYDFFMILIEVRLLDILITTILQNKQTMPHGDDDERFLTTSSILSAGFHEAFS